MRKVGMKWDSPKLSALIQGKTLTIYFYVYFVCEALGDEGHKSKTPIIQEEGRGEYRTCLPLPGQAGLSASFGTGRQADF